MVLVSCKEIFFIIWVGHIYVIRYKLVQDTQFNRSFRPGPHAQEALGMCDMYKGAKAPQRIFHKWRRKDWAGEMREVTGRWLLHSLSLCVCSHTVMPLIFANPKHQTFLIGTPSSARFNVLLTDGILCLSCSLLAESCVALDLYPVYFRCSPIRFEKMSLRISSAYCSFGSQE